MSREEIRVQPADAVGVSAQFSIKRSLLYELDSDGLVESVSLRRRGRTRGKRLFNVDSIRSFLREQKKEKNAGQKNEALHDLPETKRARGTNRGRTKTSSNAKLSSIVRTLQPSSSGYPKGDFTTQGSGALLFLWRVSWLEGEAAERRASKAERISSGAFVDAGLPR